MTGVHTNRLRKLFWNNEADAIEAITGRVNAPGRGNGNANFIAAIRALDDFGWGVGNGPMLQV